MGEIHSGVPDERLRRVDEALSRANGAGSTDRHKWLLTAMIGASFVACCLMGFLLWQSARLTEAVADKNKAIVEVREVLHKVEHAEQRSQCYFTLIAERSLEPDPQVQRQMAIDYLEGRRCPALPPPAEANTDPQS